MNYLFLLVQLGLFMPATTKEIPPGELVGLLGQSLQSQNVFLGENFLPATDKDKEEHFPLMIDRTLQQPETFSLFGITLDELHLKLDENNKVVAVFVQLDNQDLVKKMEKLIGAEYMASGASVGNQPTAESNFSWDYKGKCVTLNLNAYRVQLKPKIVRDYGLVIFNDCNPLSYITVPNE